MKEYDVVVLGAGVTGLTAAHQLKKKGYNVLVLEKEKEIGGLLRTTDMRDENNRRYHIEEFYHHVFKKDVNLINLCKELGLKILWEKMTVAFFYDKVYSLSSTIDLLFFKPFNLIEKIRLCNLMLHIRLAKKTDMFIYDWIIKHGGKQLYEKMFRHLLYNKFKEKLYEVSADYFIERINLGSVKYIGYMDGGFYRLLIKLSESLVIQTNVKLQKIEGNIIKFNNKKIRTKYIISTIPLEALNKYVKFPPYFSEKLKSFEYEGSICALMTLKKRIMNHYWTNIMKRGYVGAIVELSNLYNKIPHTIYLASYPDKKSGLWKLSDKRIFDKFINDVPFELNKNEIIQWKVFKERSAGIIYKKNFNILGLETPIRNIFIGGMFNTYPDKLIDSSIKKGKELASLVVSKLTK